jgi:hypothetical protein
LTAIARVAVKPERGFGVVEVALLGLMSRQVPGSM